MSIEAIAATMNHSKSKGISRATLLALAWHIGEDPTLGCYPSQERLAMLVNTNVRQIQRALSNLVEIGEVETITHDGIGTRADRKTNRYYIRLDCPEGCDNTLAHNPTTRHFVPNDPTFRTSRDDISYVTTRHLRRVNSN